MPLQIDRIQGQVFRDRILEAIENALISGTLRPGDRLAEAEIAREAGISRGPVREAIQRLVAEGILVTVPHRGTFVARWNEADVAETYGLRAILESYAARRAMERLSPEGFASLEAILADMFERARAGDVAGVHDLDLQFHHHLYELSGHSLVRRVLGDIWRRISMLVNLDATTTPDLVDYATNHRVLLEALRTGRGEEVERVFRDHITAVGDALIQRMREEKKLLASNSNGRPEEGGRRGGKRGTVA
jgi:DNA-binding GntR family transcriptional regulator